MFCPVEIDFKMNKKIKDIVISCLSGITLLIADETCTDLWGLTDILENLELTEKITWVRKIHPNPTQRDILNVCNIIRNRNLDRIDQIIAIGGGSCIDLAKSISAIYPILFISKKMEIDFVTDLIINKKYTRKDGFINIIAIPSTAGTGSELTNWATIWDEKGLEKHSIESIGLYPKKAIIVPELTLTLPSLVTLSTGLDALAHAIESYWAISSSVIVKDIAIQAIHRIIGYLRKAIEEPHNIYFRVQLFRGSIMSALAFSQTRTTACHALSYPLTLKYGVSHGLAVAMLLQPIANINNNNYSYESELLEQFDNFGNIRGFIEYASRDILDLRLSNFNISAKDISGLVDSVGPDSQRLSNNPVILNNTQIDRIFHEIL